eukprot:602099-Pyramimonas_sp.AAC.1
MTSFGPLVQKVVVPVKDAAPLELWVQHPFGWLEAASKQSGYFSGLLKSVLDSSKNKLDVYVHCDEVTPGDPLAEHNARK